MTAIQAALKVSACWSELVSHTYETLTTLISWRQHTYKPLTMLIPWRQLTYASLKIPWFHDLQDLEWRKLWLQVLEQCQSIIWAEAQNKTPSLNSLFLLITLQDFKSRVCMSKHLKAELGPRVCNVTYWDQRRSVGTPREWKILSLNCESWSSVGIQTQNNTLNGQLGLAACRWLLPS